MSFTDPIDPPEGGLALKAADLQNKVCLFRPTGEGEWPAKAAHTDENGKTFKAQGPQPYIECDVWVLDRAGIVEEGTEVRVSWWKAVAQLKDVEFGDFVLAMPRKEDDSNAIVLIKTSKQEWRDVGSQAVKEIREREYRDAPAEPVAAQPETDYDGSDEPF